MNIFTEIRIFELVQAATLILNIPFLHFLDQTFRKRLFLVKLEKVNITIKFSKFNLSSKFYLKYTVLIFWTKFAQKGNFWSKAEKMNNTIKFTIFKLLQMSNFILNRKFLFVWPNLSKKGKINRIKEQKNKRLRIKRRNRHCHQIHHNRITIDAQISFQTDNSRFLDQICLKRLFPVQNTPNEHPH